MASVSELEVIYHTPKTALDNISKRHAVNYTCCYLVLGKFFVRWFWFSPRFTLGFRLASLLVFTYFNI